MDTPRRENSTPTNNVRDAPRPTAPEITIAPMLRFTAKSPPALETLLTSPLERAAAEPDYWGSDRYYALGGAAVEQLLVPAVRDLWAMCLDFVGRAVRDEEVLASLGIPDCAWEGVAASWSRGETAPLARFDLSFDGRAPPKLHECNIDVVGLLYEATFFQRAWMAQQRGREPGFAGYGHFTEIEAGLADALGPHAATGPIALVSIGLDPYDELWISSVARILAARGMASDCARFASAPAFLAWAGAHPPGTPERHALKAFRWDLLLPHGGNIQALIGPAPRLSSPMWSLVLSSKGCLPWLWRMNPDHPNLLEASFKATQLTTSDGFVSKPLFSIQGQGVALSDACEPTRNLVTSGEATVATRVYQALCYLPQFQSGSGPCWASTGAWVANGEPAGISMTEASSPVITGTSIRYVPHVLR